MYSNIYAHERKGGKPSFRRRIVYMRCLLGLEADLFYVHLSSELLLKSELNLMKNDINFMTLRAIKLEYKGNSVFIIF
jgi:hypothetical protein